MRVFVTGATGFVGENVARDLRARGHDVIAATRETFALEAPTIPHPAEAVVHCAAIASVKACDLDPARAERLNVEATRTLAIEARRRAIPLVLTSTDLVFDGAGAPYAEGALPAPPTRYGQTKLRAEHAVLDADPRHAVLRLALVVGAHRGRPGGFLAWLVDDLRAGRALALFENQRRAPLFVSDVAPIVDALVTRRLTGGVYHLASERSLSRVEIGHAVAHAFELDARGIVPTMQDRGAALPSIDDTTLDTTKVRRTLGVSFTSLDEALARVRAAISA